MLSLAMAYFVAWALVAAYGGWLGLQHRRLAQRLNAAERQLEEISVPQRRSSAA
jgi:hypothetical protein